MGFVCQCLWAFNILHFLFLIFRALSLPSPPLILGVFFSLSLYLSQSLSLPYFSLLCHSFFLILHSTFLCSCLLGLPRLSFCLSVSSPFHHSPSPFFFPTTLLPQVPICFWLPIFFSPSLFPPFLISLSSLPALLSFSLSLYSLRSPLSLSSPLPPIFLISFSILPYLSFFPYLSFTPFLISLSSLPPIFVALKGRVDRR